MFDITKYSSDLGFILEKRDGKVFVTYSKHDPITGEKLQTIKESLNTDQILTLRDRLQRKLDNVDALINDIEKEK